MAKKKTLHLGRKGQSTVEYILLFLIISALTTTVLKHPRFKEFFGSDSEFFAKLGSTIQFSYRHGKPGLAEADTSDYTRFHETYYNAKDGHTHFFLGTEAYGGQ